MGKWTHVYACIFRIIVQSSECGAKLCHTKQELFRGHPIAFISCAHGKHFMSQIDVVIHTD